MQQKMCWKSLILVCALALVMLTPVVRPVTAQTVAPQVRFAHLAIEGGPVDVYLDGAPAVEALAFGQTSVYVPLTAMNANAMVVPAGIAPEGAEDSALVSLPLAFAEGESGYYTVILIEGGGALQAHVLPADGTPPATGAASTGDLAISGAFVRATGASGTHHGSEHHSQGGAPMGGVTAAYMLITNGGETADRLVAASADAAQTVEIHETILENDVARMQMLPDGLEIPAGGSAELKPAGLHLMLIGLPRPLLPGQTVTLTLAFESGATLVLRAPVRMP